MAASFRLLGGGCCGVVVWFLVGWCDYENFDSLLQGFFVNSNSLGARLRTARKGLGKSQDDMAAACGVSREMWGKYERDAAMPGGEVLIKVALAGIDVNYILTGQRAGGVKPAPTLTAEEETMLGYFRDASKEVRRAALGALLGASAPVGNAQTNVGDNAIQIGSVAGKARIKNR